MKCKKVRQYQSKFCPQDFNHEFTFYKKSTFRQATFDEQDITYQKETEFKMMGFIKIQNADIEINGEVVSGNSEIIKITTYILNDFLNIKKNILDYYVYFQNQEYRLQAMELVDFNYQYVDMICKRDK